MRKAIGWALREHSKYKPKDVIAFVKEREKTLSHLSKVEALKYLHNQADSKFKDLDIPNYVGKSKS